MSYGHISSLIHLMIIHAIPIPSQIMFKNYIHIHVNDVYMKEFIMKCSMYGRIVNEIIPVEMNIL